MSELAPDGMVEGVTPENQAALAQNDKVVEAQAPAVSAVNFEIGTQVDDKLKELHPGIKLPALENAGAPDLLYKAGVSKDNIKPANIEYTLPNSEQVSALVAKVQAGERLTIAERNSFAKYFSKQINTENPAQIKEAWALAGKVFTPEQLGKDANFWITQGYLNRNFLRLASSGAIVEGMTASLNVVSREGRALRELDKEGLLSMLHSLEGINQLVKSEESLQPLQRMLPERLFKNAVELMSNSKNLLKLVDPERQRLFSSDMKIRVETTKVIGELLASPTTEGNLIKRIQLLQTLPPDMVAGVMTHLSDESVAQNPMVVAAMFDTLAKSILVKYQTLPTKFSYSEQIAFKNLVGFVKNIEAASGNNNLSETGLRIITEQIPTFNSFNPLPTAA